MMATEHDWENRGVQMLEEIFWENYPNEISWNELKMINPEMYCKLQNIGQILVLRGCLKSAYLEDK